MRGTNHVFSVGSNAAHGNRSPETESISFFSNKMFLSFSRTEMAEDGRRRRKREGLVEWRSGAMEVKVVRKRGKEDSVGGSLGGRGGALDGSPVLERGRERRRHCRALVDGWGRIDVAAMGGPT